MRQRTKCCLAYFELVDMAPGPDPLGIYQKNPICGYCKAHQVGFGCYSKKEIVAGDVITQRGEPTVRLTVVCHRKESGVVIAERIYPTSPPRLIMHHKTSTCEILSHEACED